MLVQAKGLTHEGTKWKLNVRHNNGQQYADLLQTAAPLEPADLCLELTDLSQLIARGALTLTAVDLSLDQPPPHGLLTQALGAR